MLLAIPLALLAGVLSFLSPCVLPLLPGYLGYVSGNAQRKSIVIIGAVLFVLGFTAVFVLLGILAGAAGLVFFTTNTWVQVVLGAIVVLLGFAMIGQVSFLQKTIKLPITPKIGLVGAPVLGAVFAIGWTPCIGPTLASVLVLASDAGDPARGAMLATVYSLGLGIPFVLIAAGAGFAVNSVAYVKRHIRAFNIFGGALLIAIGLLMVTGLWNQLVYWLQVVTVGFQLPL
jgi:cytochrome c-type biogenesis protein